MNEVRLSGRVSVDPEERVLPSGDRLWVFRLVVQRAPRAGMRQSVDTLECAAWTPRLHRSVSAWRAGDEVEISGALRRRFFKAGGGAASRVEVEVATGRLIRRAATS
ncbi:single-stranded DNA-binding protein [Nocardioides ferulae]|uniref:single-stranded DNA-binding protein n=1 Tax=Nocardioides ferulae TaxID=2340821 RepID=UPI001F0BDE0C|nr:single-stranded DNA-binding protein [Nocardioides ferulae]